MQGGGSCAGRWGPCRKLGAMQGGGSHAGGPTPCRKAAPCAVGSRRDSTRAVQKGHAWEGLQLRVCQPLTFIQGASVLTCGPKQAPA